MARYFWVDYLCCFKLNVFIKDNCLKWEKQIEHMFMIIIRLFYAETIEAIIKFYWFASRFFTKILQGVLNTKLLR